MSCARCARRGSCGRSSTACSAWKSSPLPAHLYSRQGRTAGKIAVIVRGETVAEVQRGASGICRRWRQGASVVWQATYAPRGVAGPGGRRGSWRRHPRPTAASRRRLHLLGRVGVRLRTLPRLSSTDNAVSSLGASAATTTSQSPPPGSGRCPARSARLARRFPEGLGALPRLLDVAGISWSVNWRRLTKVGGRRVGVKRVSRGMPARYD